MTLYVIGLGAAQSRERQHPIAACQRGNNQARTPFIGFRAPISGRHPRKLASAMVVMKHEHVAADCSEMADLSRSVLMVS
jgi:hypothetical protein